MEGGRASKKCRRSSSAFPGSPIAEPGRIKCFEKFLCCFLWKNPSLRAGLGAQGELLLCQGLSPLHTADPTQSHALLCGPSA